MACKKDVLEIQPGNMSSNMVKVKTEPIENKDSASGVVPLKGEDVESCYPALVRIKSESTEDINIPNELNTKASDTVELETVSDIKVSCSDKSINCTNVERTHGIDQKQKHETHLEEIDQKVMLLREDVIKEEEIKIESIETLPDLEACDEEEQKKKKKRHQDYCYFCESLVSNFARHLQRKHQDQPEVRNILALDPNNRERKLLINTVRKKGNFIKCDSECFKPMRKSVAESLDSYRACNYCLGFYSKACLWRHRKQCPERPAAGRGKNRLVSLVYSKVEIQLREKIFPAMRQNRITSVAQRDVLICAYGASCMKTHKERHFRSVISRKMRELARLLLELRRIDSSIKNLFESLDPKHYDNLVEATKRVSGFDRHKQTFKAPSFAMSVGTSLKKCCDEALVCVLKGNIKPAIPREELEANLKTLSNLFLLKWKFDVSSKVATNLCAKKKESSDVTIVSLDNDLKLLIRHLLFTASTAKLELAGDKKTEYAYRILLECTFCQMLLLNRKRLGKLQRLLLDSYNISQKNNCFEKFVKIKSPTEKVLTQHLKRVIIREEWGRYVPVIFNNDIQNDLDLLLKLRHNFTPEENKYLFGLPRCTNNIYGFKALVKYASSCKAKNPEAMSCTRLRTHLAILTQIYNMTENDLKRLETFMSDTVGIHTPSNKSSDILHTSKIAKILLLIENGTCPQFNGKTIEEVDVDLDEDLLEVTDENVHYFSDSDAENEPYYAKLFENYEQRKLKPLELRNSIDEDSCPVKTDKVSNCDIIEANVDNSNVKSDSCTTDTSALKDSSKETDNIDNFSISNNSCAINTSVVKEPSKENADIDNCSDNSDSCSVKTSSAVKGRKRKSDLDDASLKKHSNKKRKIQRIPWTSEQKQVVVAFFKEHIKNSKPPKRHECEELKEMYPDLLSNKDWLKMKVMVQNLYSHRLKYVEDM